MRRFTWEGDEPIDLDAIVLNPADEGDLAAAAEEVALHAMTDEHLMEFLNWVRQTKARAVLLEMFENGELALSMEEGTPRFFLREP